MQRVPTQTEKYSTARHALHCTEKLSFVWVRVQDWSLAQERNVLWLFVYSQLYQFIKCYFKRRHIQYILCFHWQVCLIMHTIRDGLSVHKPMTQNGNQISNGTKSQAQLFLVCMLATASLSTGSLYRMQELLKWTIQVATLSNRQQTMHGLRLV